MPACATKHILSHTWSHKQSWNERISGAVSGMGGTILCVAQKITSKMGSQCLKCCSWTLLKETPFCLFIFPATRCDGHVSWRHHPQRHATLFLVCGFLWRDVVGVDVVDTCPHTYRLPTVRQVPMKRKLFWAKLRLFRSWDLSDVSWQTIINTGTINTVWWRKGSSLY